MILRTARIRTLVDLVVFHFAWFGIVWGAGRGSATLVVLSAGAQVAVHLGLSPVVGKDLLRALVVGTLGWGMDSLLGAAGVFAFPGALAPAWLWCLWVAFATTLEPGLSWFRRRLPLAASLGAVAGPFSYEVGVRLGAVSWGVPAPLGWVVLAVVWAVALPAMLRYGADGDGNRSVA